MNFLMLMLVLVGSACGLPQKNREESRDLAILQRYLTKALNEIDERQRPPKGIPGLQDIVPSVTIDQVLTTIASNMDPADIVELNKPVLDMDIETATEEALHVIEVYFGTSGVTTACIDLTALIGTMPFAMVTDMIPVRIALLSTITRILMVAVSETEELKNIQKLSKGSMGNMIEKVEETGKSVVTDMGIPEDAKIGGIVGALTGVEIAKAGLTTKGVEIVAAVVQGLATVVDKLGSDLQSATCDPAAVQTTLGELERELENIIMETQNMEGIERVFNVGAETAGKIQNAVTTILTGAETYSVLTYVVQATPAGEETLAEAMLKVVVNAVLRVAQNMVTTEKNLQDLVTVIRPNIPEIDTLLDTDIKDVHFPEVMKSTVEIMKHVQQVFSYTCEEAKIAAVIAGHIEKKREDYSLVNPMTTMIKDKIVKLAEVLDTAASSEELAENIGDKLEKIFHDIFKETVLPLANEIDALNGGIRLETRYLPFVMQTIFMVHDPRTLKDLLKTAMMPVVAAFTKEESCGNGVTIPKISQALENTLDSIDAAFTGKIVTIANNIQSDFSLDDATTTTLTELLTALAKVIMPQMNSDLLGMQETLDIDPSIDNTRAAMGAQAGFLIYEEVWMMRTIRSMAKLLKTRD